MFGVKWINWKEVSMNAANMSDVDLETAIWKMQSIKF